MQKKYYIIIFIILTIGIITTVAVFKNIAIQEKNSIPMVKGIVKLNLSDKKVIRISQNPEKYIIKILQYETFFDFMKNEGWIYKGRMGAGMIFYKDNEWLVATAKVYSKKYEVIMVTRNINNINFDDKSIDKESLFFNMEFRYGVGAKNILNTFEGSFTKDMVIGEPVIIPFKLSPEQIKNIYKKMIDIDLFSYPQNYNPINNYFITPFDTYYFKVQTSSGIKEITWEDEHMVQDKKSKQLRELIMLIKDYIQDTSQFKNLPPARGGYD